jgi:thioredoxin:protein disulfide reductase
MRIKLLILAVGLLIAPTLSLAEPNVEMSAALNVSALTPGQQGKLAVILDIPDGYHAQSNTPTDDSAIKCEIKLDDIPGIEFGTVVYPPGVDQDFPALGKLNVYINRAVIRVPFTVTKDAKLGSIKLSGKVQLQICDTQSCFPPMNNPFSVEADVVPNGTTITATHAELFPDKSKSSPDKSSATTTTQPAADSAK